MIDPSSLPPDALDRLEDALDDPARRAALEPELRELAEAYARIETMARSALDETPVPAGLEDRVLEAVARAAAESPPAAAGAPPPARAPQSRWRRLWMPLLAVAGSAAVVLWWVRATPEADPARGARPHTVTERELLRGPPPEAEETRALEAPEPDRASAPSAPAATPAGEPPALQTLPAAGAAGASSTAPEDLDAATPAEPKKHERTSRRRGRSSRKAAKRRQAAPAPRPAPARASDDGLAGFGGGGAKAAEAEAAPAAPAAPAASGTRPLPLTWQTLARADRARRTGRCDRAVPLYRRLTAAGDRALAARAHAGLGLCAEAAGRSGAADFTRARALDPNIDAFLAGEAP